MMLPLTLSSQGCARAAGGRRVLIIGAGMAGLAAAAALVEAGLQPIVLEARDRIGGRIHTSRVWPDYPMDLGASWIHGTKGNPVTALARTAGAAFIPTSYDRTLLHIDPTLRARGVRDRGTGGAERRFERAMAWAENQPQDVSIQTALDAVAPAGAIGNVAAAQLDFLVNSAFEQEYSGSARQMSAWMADASEEFEGEDVLFPGGYGQITDFLARGLDIRLGRSVRSVKVTSTAAMVGLDDGSTLEADQVLVTVPLGVLKAGAIRFDPPLGSKQQLAIDRLGMGLLNKHWLRFDRIFWPPDFDWHEYLSATKGHWSQWVSLAKHDETPVLLAFSAADNADAIEGMRDADIIASIMDTARKMFGSSAPDPVAVQITRWRADPLSRGSYSFHAVGSGPDSRRALAQSEAERLHFAGEATQPLYAGTVHGALLSGREAAARIIRAG